MTIPFWRKWLLTSILELIFITSSTGNIALRKRLMVGGKLILVLKIIVKQWTLWWDKEKLFFETLVTPIILYGCEVWGCSISRESWRKIEQIQKRFITYNLKIKRNTPYHILLIKVGLSPIESLAMTRILLYKYKINNMGDHTLPKLAFHSSQNHLRLEQGWYKDGWIHGPG